nr:heme uptake protein IsdC [Priestia taiwanensis]
MLAIVCMMVFTLAPSVQAAAKLEDGTYTINYVIKKADKDSVSMANDYFEKPAKLFVKNGEMKVHVQMNHSAWITEFKGPVGGGFADSKVVSEDKKADKRTVEFNVKDLSQPTPAQIHVTVTSVNYDHDYTIRFAFDEKSAKPVAGTKAVAGEGTKQPSAKAATTTGESKTPVENPETGDSTNVIVFSVLFVSSLIFLISSQKFRRTNKS